MQVKVLEEFLKSANFKALKIYKAYLELNYYPNNSNRFADEIVEEFSRCKAFIISDYVSNKIFYKAIEYYYNVMSGLTLERDLFKTFDTKVISGKRIAKKYYSLFIDEYVDYSNEVSSIVVSYLKPSQIEEVKSLRELVGNYQLFVAEREILLDDVSDFPGMIEGLAGVLYEYKIEEVF
ncbi:hypothetical protein YS40_102 [Thermus phage phiYS40]|uniref:hypothetical protein n=1 Tax=Thermus phage phiYS40 TaxID=407392 RepID=UPI0000E689DC|nr:hypothetical protein YS40_102 [Thermus phage phiYS40]ABJ91496.1 hypothetical protein YS40_102 [Thermus phage phiYS40]BAK53620.1 hypothetical protein YSP_102 [Thermus phage phiYS40]